MEHIFKVAKVGLWSKWDLWGQVISRKHKFLMGVMGGHEGHSDNIWSLFCLCLQTEMMGSLVILVLVPCLWL